MIYVDLDGVLRDLCAVAKIEPTEYDCKVCGEPFMDFFTKRLYLLELAPPTEYLKVLSDYLGFIQVITNQPSAWVTPTMYWVRNNIKVQSSVMFTSEDKLALLKDKDILIEDFPNFSDYSKVILIDRPYNRNIQLPHTRVTNPFALIDEIERRVRLNVAEI